MHSLVESAYNPETGKGYGSKAIFETFEHAVTTGDYDVVKAMVYGHSRLVLPIMVKQHKADLMRLAIFGNCLNLRRKNNMVNLLNKIANEVDIK